MDLISIAIRRILLYFACRKFLLRAIYHDLRTLTYTSHVDTAEGEEDDAEEHELDSLNSSLPMTRNSPPDPPLARTIHSTLSRASFALCFSESCMLFVLVLCQGLGVFNPRCVLQCQISNLL